MDRGAWQVIDHVASGIRHDLANKPPSPLSGYQNMYQKNNLVIPGLRTMSV